MNRKKFIKIIEKIEFVREIITQFGIVVASMLGLIFGSFAMIIIISDKGQEIPKLFDWIFSGLGHWIVIVLILSFVSLCMRAIANNKKNWVKK